MFIETKSPAGYELEEVEYTFTVGDGKIDPITVTNKMKLVTIELQKKDIATGEALAGAVFTLTNADGTVKFENLDTDAEGKLTIENAPEGTYTLTETKRPEGYQTLPNPIVIEVTHDAPAVIEIEVPNAPLGHAQIMKVETGTTLPIAGVTFTLEKQNANGDWEFVEEVVTDELGFAFSEKLDLGTYRYVETNAPEGVIIENEPVVFEVNQQHFEKADLSFTAENAYKAPILELEKQDKKGKALQGAQFELYKVERTGEDTLIPNGEQNFFETDENGKISVEVSEAGEYYFVETKAPKGYILNKTPQSVTVEKGLTAKVTMQNEKAPIIVVKGSVELTKVDSKNKEEYSTIFTKNLIS